MTCIKSMSNAEFWLRLHQYFGDNHEAALKDIEDWITERWAGVILQPKKKATLKTNASWCLFHAELCDILKRYGAPVSLVDDFVANFYNTRLYIAYIKKPKLAVPKKKKRKKPKKSPKRGGWLWKRRLKRVRQIPPEGLIYDRQFEQQE